MKKIILDGNNIKNFGSVLDEFYESTWIYFWSWHGSWFDSMRDFLDPEITIEDYELKQWEWIIIQIDNVNWFRTNHELFNLFIDDIASLNYEALENGFNNFFILTYNYLHENDKARNYKYEFIDWVIYTKSLPAKSWFIDKVHKFLMKFVGYLE